MLPVFESILFDVGIIDVISVVCCVIVDSVAIGVRIVLAEVVVFVVEVLVIVFVDVVVVMGDRHSKQVVEEHEKFATPRDSLAIGTKHSVPFTARQRGEAFFEISTP